ncbi:MAG: hypothetical protein H0V04_06200 [Chloroflexi bacterium]|nr:hypothetical protein [Chloroflexota bacterium]
MHMLRDEDNAGYRTVIRNTLAFDPEILKRYVDFMSNPDERTAVDQFGDGDKYFGVATVLATLPGLPMFGHGQVEGFAERYGMEFRRARLEEHPNQGLVERHEHEIFPLLHQRALFAEARDFALFDLVTADGSVNEDVYAYTNAADGRHSLVVYHNRYAEARGHIRACVPSMRPVDGGERASVSWTLAEALALPAEPGAFVVLRDIRSGMEWLHDCRALHELGLELDLRAYECRVFIDPVIRWDSPDGDLARLAWQLGGRPVPSVDEALDAMVSAPLRDGVAALIDAEAFRRIAGSALARDASAAAQMLTGEAALAADRMARLAEVDGHAGPQASVLAELDARLRALTALVRLGRGREAHPAAQRVGRWLGTDRARWATILGWMYADAARTLLEVAPVTEGWSQKRGVDAALHRAALGLGVSDEEAQRAVEVARGLLAAPDAPFASSDVRAATGWHPWEDAAYVQREAFEDFVDALIARDVTLAAARGEGPEALGVLMEVLEGWREAVGSAGWRVGSVDEEAG